MSVLQKMIVFELGLAKRPLPAWLIVGGVRKTSGPVETRVTL